MCEVKIVKQQGGEEVILLKDVYLIEQDDEGLRFETIFGEQKVYEAEIESVSLSDNKVVIREKSV
jgi:predicted RNA-binding protein